MKRSQRIAAAWLLLIAFSITLHLWQLDARTFHSDEAVHAKLAYDFAVLGNYRYDPTYHGPLLYFLTAFIYWILGDSDFTARLGIALCGIGMLWIAWRIRRPFGGSAAWWAGLLVTISPLSLYYSRFLRMDMLEMLTASAALLGLYAAFRWSDRYSDWKWVGIWGALAFATKENAYITAFLLVVTLILVAFTFGFRSYFEMALRAARDKKYGLAIAVGWFIICVLLLYTVFLKYPDDWSFTVRAVRHWAYQHATERVGGPWWYHLLPLLQYEFLILGAAAAWVFRRRQLRPVEVGLFLFGMASLVMYAYLGEKVAWLGVHQIWAFIPLAAAQLARTFGPRGAWWSRTLAGAGLLMTLLASLTANFVLSEISPNMDRVESLHYVQTSPELKAIVDDIRAQSALGEYPAAIVVGDATWPMVWYLRHDPVRWSLSGVKTRPPVVILDPEQEQSLCGQLCSDSGYRRALVPLRSWWLPQQESPGIYGLLRYLVTRKPWIEVGTRKVLVLQRACDARITCTLGCCR